RSEIEQHRVSTARDDHVRRLDVEMHKPATVDMLQSRTKMDGDADGIRYAQPVCASLIEQMAKRWSFQKFHQQQAWFLKAQKTNDVRMSERAYDICFALRAMMGAEDLASHRTPRAVVPPYIDRILGTAVDDAQYRDVLADPRPGSDEMSVGLGHATSL